MAKGKKKLTDAQIRRIGGAIGASFLSKAWKAVKKVGKDVGKTAINVLKTAKPLSTTVGSINPLLGNLAAKTGFGKRRKTRK